MTTPSSPRSENKDTGPSVPDPFRFKLVIAYDGSAYAGWQVQKTGTAVQEKIEQALTKLFSGAPRLFSSSRTDTGVHALGMVAHLDLPRRECRMAPAKLRLALNAHLPSDIRIVQISRCAGNFHARFDASGKQYRYFIWNHESMNPLLRALAWHVPQRLDFGAMRSASAFFLGTHDFKSFAATRSYEAEDTVRTVTRCDVRRSGPLITVLIEGDGFLYKMCRGMVGTLIQIGAGKYLSTDARRMLADRDRRCAGMTAPAHGLVLWKVYYRKKPVRRRKPG